MLLNVSEESFEGSMREGGCRQGQPIRRNVPEKLPAPCEVNGNGAVSPT